VTATTATPTEPRPPTAVAQGQPAAGRVTATRAFAWRTVLRIRHVPEQLFDVIVIPVVFTVLFTYLLGGALAGSPSVYLQALLPGTLVMTLVLLTTFTGVGLRSDLDAGVHDRFRSLPVWRPAPLAGALVGDLGRYLIAAAIVLALGLALGFRPGGGVTGVLAALGVVLVFAHALSWVWIVVGLRARSVSAVNAVSLGLLFPLTITSNVFADPATMPGWLRPIVEHNPVSFVVTAARGLMHGNAAAVDVAWALAVSAVVLAVFLPLSLHRYRTHRS
jgi:ABC-2 type transport system permease protein